jgi:hypothetical protein
MSLARGERLIRYGSYFNLASLTVDPDRPPITIVLDSFHSRRCASLQEANEGGPVERWAIGQMEGDMSNVVRIAWLNCRMPLNPE